MTPLALASAACFVGLLVIGVGWLLEVLGADAARHRALAEQESPCSSAAQPPP